MRECCPFIALVIVSFVVNINSFVKLSSHNYELRQCNYKKTISVPENVRRFANQDNQPSEIKNNRRVLIDNNNIDPVRFFAFNFLALFLALGANFLGVTSYLLSINPAYFRNVGLDQIYAIDGYKKYVDTNNNYMFRYPYDWLVDQSIVLADIKDRETPSELRNRRPKGIRPEVAFGPAGVGDNRENLSIIKSTVLPGFSLEKTLGEPREAALKLLDNFIATPSSGKTYKLLNSFSDFRKGREVYQFEYIVSKGDLFNQHSVSVIANKDRDLYTLTAVAPESKWNTEKDKIIEIANSFEITST